MILCADLHTHSTASDGQYAPAEVVRRAKEAGVECLAVTDHDTLDGVEAASRAGEALGLRVLRGVELGAKEDRHMHILGLGLRPDCDGLLELCRKLLDGRNERKYRIIDFLKEKGIDISLDEVEAVAGGAVIARPHFAQVMLQHGYVSSSREAFDRYLDTDEYQRIERFKAGAEECIRAIHDLECYSPRHTPEMVREYLALAGRFDLRISGGSDFHGEGVRPDTALTPTPLELSWLLD